MLGFRIRQYRETNKYSQKELAKILGVSPRSIMRWEQNETTPNAEELEKITSLLGITEDDLMSATDDGNSLQTNKRKQNTLEKISDGVDNLVTGQETLNESLMSNRDEYIKKQDELIKELRNQNKQLLVKIDGQSDKIESYERALDTTKVSLKHKRIRTAVIIITCLIILGIVAGSWLYWRNHSVSGKYIEGPAVKGEPSYFEIDDGK